MSATDGSLEERALVKPDKNNFAPRLGAIYSLGARTILRGGYGVFYNQFERIGSTKTSSRSIRRDAQRVASTLSFRLYDAGAVAEGWLSVELPRPARHRESDAARGEPIRRGRACNSSASRSASGSLATT